MMVQAKALANTASGLAGLIRETRSQSEQAQITIADANRKHDDVLHRIEAVNCLYAERARLATQLAASQRERREYKDWLHNMKPIFAWLESAKGKNLENLLSEFLGVARSVKANPKIDD